MRHSMTMGHAIRLLENHDYVVVCHDSGTRRPVTSMRDAMRVAKAMARQMPRHVIHIHLPSGAPHFGPRSLVATVEASRDGYRVRFNKGLQGLGSGPLTSWACDTSIAEDKIQDAMSTAAISAAVGGTVAGLAGSLLKRPVMGAFVGAGVGWITYALWTAPLRSS